MAKQVGPGSEHAEVCHAPRARQVYERPIRRFHQGQRAFARGKVRIYGCNPLVVSDRLGAWQCGGGHIWQIGNHTDEPEGSPARPAAIGADARRDAAAKPNAWRMWFRAAKLVVAIERRAKFRTKRSELMAVRAGLVMPITFSTFVSVVSNGWKGAKAVHDWGANA